MTIAPPRRASRRAICIFALSFLALVVSLGWRQLRPPSAMIAGAPLEELRHQADALRPYDDVVAAAAEAHRVELMGQLWTAERFAEWKRGLPSRWTIQEAKPQSNEYTVTRRIVLNRPGANARDWPEIHEFLRQVDALPAAVVAGLTLTMPQPQTRQFQTIQVVLALAFRKEPAEAEQRKG